MSDLLPPPRLVRSHATTTILPPPAPLGEAQRLTRQVLTAYANLPFKGQALVLPGDVVVADDLWRCKLEDHLEDLADDGLDALKAFSLEAWLMTKIESEGTTAQKEELRHLQARLDEVEAKPRAFEIIDDGYGHVASGLPSDILSVVHQPVTEIEVYRDLAELSLMDDDATTAAKVDTAAKEGTQDQAAAHDDDDDDSA
mmetsp:Transcript_9282/g.23622  ORF Transcript_9282/g.23622 Transcript_9282/m.23622 type:complete len:199 (+) Transcript_9282:148-744(+)|eukprot:CAMPEP_0197413542 /NCGR_PEP_ID=MMETSP1170-20131217/398_1 /TAXON_ID=54406 /ORGANISM="Sarcinochrysis sp, Strain CCMP770" /LENGTH=198 /DNA_ID=CAMNT_0042940137 /DNA_START=148 /DNA_END=744 /DNA_ORIENTATION=-